MVVYNPNAKLYHYESKTRGYDDTEEKAKRFESEIDLFKRTWNEILEKGDPYYNINLKLDIDDYKVRREKV